MWVVFSFGGVVYMSVVVVCLLLVVVAGWVLGCIWFGIWCCLCFVFGVVGGGGVLALGFWLLACAYVLG